jgi:hypothetical protein
MCFWPFFSRVAIVRAQVAVVGELGVARGAQTRNRRAPIETKKHAAWARDRQP